MKREKRKRWGRNTESSFYRRRPFRFPFRPRASSASAALQPPDRPRREVKVSSESQGLEEERSISCQFYKRRSDASISPGRASFHVLSFQFHCPPTQAARGTEIKHAYVSIYQFVQKKIEYGMDGNAPCSMFFT